MDGLSAGQRAMLRACGDHLIQAKLQAGAVLSTIPDSDLLTAAIGIVEAETRLLAALVYAAANDRPDLRTDWCAECRRVTSHRLERGQMRCVVCGCWQDTPEPDPGLRLVERGAA